MEGIIYINGQIGSTPTEKGVELIDIIQQVKAQEGALSFRVHINSEGGVVDTGFDIFNYLKSLQLPITTVGSGLVASIATVIFMAGTTEY
jgi:ATP-dependent protease ClpP protease subunit